MWPAGQPTTQYTRLSFNTHADTISSIRHDVLPFVKAVKIAFRPRQ